MKACLACLLYCVRDIAAGVTAQAGARATLDLVRWAHHKLVICLGVMPGGYYLAGSGVLARG